MLERMRINKWIMLVAVIAIVLLAAVGVYKTMIENYVSIHGQQLYKYSYSSGGGMNGGYHRETVKRYGDQALISIQSADWYLQDPVVTEYKTDAAVLDELEAVVRKYKMNFWHRKKFTNEFVFDGESESYHFNFDDASIWFSSQIYPLRYAKKLAELDHVIEKYIEAGEKLPGLVNLNTIKEEYDLLPEDEFVIYVYSYAENALGLRILNGTDEAVEIPETYQLINSDTDTVLLEENAPYGGSFSEQATDEMDIKLKERLDAGNYMLIFGDLEIPFEIR